MYGVGRGFIFVIQLRHFDLRLCLVVRVVVERHGAVDTKPLWLGLVYSRYGREV